MRWNIPSGLCLQSFEGHTNYINSLASTFSLSTDITTLYSGSCDNTVREWDMNTGLTRRSFTGHSKFISSVVVSGSRLYTASWDKTAKAWDIETGRCVLTYVGHEDAIRCMHLRQNTLYTGSADKMMIFSVVIYTSSLLTVPKGKTAEIHSSVP